jgi:hypothetical protein
MKLAHAKIGTVANIHYMFVPLIREHQPFYLPPR